MYGILQNMVVLKFCQWSNDIPIVSLFKSDTCGHCNKFKPTWEELQNNHPDIATYQTFDSKNDNLKFTANNINGVPSILKTHNNETVEYNGDRSTLDLKNWIQN